MSELFGKPESLPMLLFILFFAILFGAGPELRSAKYVFEPPWLLFTLNSVFITGLCLLIAGLCFRSFLRGGFLNVLLLGCGVLTFGLSSFAAGWLIHPPYGPNYTVTTHNIGVLFTAVLYFLSSLFTAFGYSLEIERRRGMIAAAACGAVFLLGAVLTVETIRQALPPFYIVGEGPTVIRQVVLSVSVTFLLTSALLMMTVYAERKTGFLFYSINALLLISTGIVGVALAVPGSPLSWLGRAAQYLGDVYLAAASMKALGEARSRGTTVERALADFFRRSETHYRALVDMAADAIVAVDRKGKIILMNPTAEETLGYGRDEAAGQSLAEQIVPEQSLELFHACLYGDPCRNIGMDLKRKDGSVFPAELSFSPKMKSDGGSERTIIIRDVTERMEAEQALRGSEARYRSYVEVTGQIGWTTNADGEIVEDMPALRKYTGQTFDEMRGWGWSKALHPDDVEITLATWRKAVEEKQGFETEARLRLHEGTYRHFLCRGVPVLRDDGSVREWVNTCIDITERKQAEETLRRSEARFRLLADSMPQLVWTAEPDGRVDYFNGRLSSFTTRAPWRPAVYAEDRPRTVEAWKRAVRTGSPYEIEHRMQLADGRFRWFLTRAIPVPDDAGSVMKWYGTSTDVHDRKQAEEEREIARIEAINEKNRLEALIKTLPVGVALVDTEGGTIQSNDMFERLWGGQRPETRSVDDYNKYTAWWIDSGRQVQPDEWASARAVQKGEAVTGQLMKIERFDGTDTFVMNSAAPIYASDGRIAGSAVAILDITERIEAEEALQQKKARFRLLSDTAGRLLATDDPQGLINQLCRDVMEHLNCQAFFNFMVDDSAGRLRLNACAGIPEEEVRKLEWLDYGVAVCGCVARDKTRIVAEDIFHTPDARTELVRSYGIQAYCCHPLKDQDRLIGTLSFGTKTRARFTPEEVELMRTVADQVAVALQRVLAQQELRKSEEALRLANEQLEQRVRERTTELILLLEDLEKSRDDLRKLASELVLAEERERKKISVALHDEVAQTLAAARMRIDLLRSKPGDDDSRRALDEAQQLLVQAIRETRSLMTDISNPVLYDMGLQVAVQSLTEEVKARNGVSFSNSFTGSLRKLDQDMEVMIFQVVKELVQNIVKHSGARKASIRIVEERDDIKVVVADDGLGFDVGSVGAVGMDGGFGLFSIRERVKSYHGKIQIESELGKGSEVTVMLPKRAAGVAASRKTRRRKGKV